MSIECTLWVELVYLEAVWDFEFGRVDSDQTIDQNHEQDGEKHGEVTDGRANLTKHTTNLQ